MPHKSNDDKKQKQNKFVFLELPEIVSVLLRRPKIGRNLNFPKKWEVVKILAIILSSLS